MTGIKEISDRIDKINDTVNSQLYPKEILYGLLAPFIIYLVLYITRPKIIKTNNEFSPSKMFLVTLLLTMCVWGGLYYIVYRRLHS